MHGQKKRRKRSIEGTADIDGFALAWTLRSEPQWSTEGGYEGLSISVQRAEGASRELILKYAFPKVRKARISSIAFRLHPGFPIRPQVSAKLVEADIRRAIAAGWDPASRGKPFVFQVSEASS
jgi:hypothetical protein